MRGSDPQLLRGSTTMLDSSGEQYQANPVDAITTRSGMAGRPVRPFESGPADQQHPWSVGVASAHHLLAIGLDMACTGCPTLLTVAAMETDSGVEPPKSRRIPTCSASSQHRGTEERESHEMKRSQKDTTRDTTPPNGQQKPPRCDSLNVSVSSWSLVRAEGTLPINSLPPRIQRDTKRNR